MVYENKPTSVSELLSDRNNKVHEELFNDAISKYINKIGEDILTFYEKNKVIELKGDEYWKPSSIMILSKIYDKKLHKFNKQIVDLTPYWNTELINKNHNIVKDTTSEIIYIDYVKGKVTIKSKRTGNTKKINFNEIDPNMEISDDMTLKGTWKYMINNK